MQQLLISSLACQVVTYSVTYSGRTGYIALYSLGAIHDAVPIPAIRRQSEAGYWSPNE